MCFLDRNQNLKTFRKTDLIYRRKAAPSTVHFVSYQIQSSMCVSNPATEFRIWEPVEKSVDKKDKGRRRNETEGKIEEKKREKQERRRKSRQVTWSLSFVLFQNGSFSFFSLSIFLFFLEFSLPRSLTSLNQGFRRFLAGVSDFMYVSNSSMLVV